MAGKIKKPPTIRRPKAGQPSKKEMIDLGLLEALYSFRMTDEEVCQILNISVASLTNYKKDEKFLASIKKGKKISDERVEKSLFERATGYDHPEEDIKVISGKIVKTETIKHYPPETSAMIFWLKNRKKEIWRDKHDLNIGMNEESINTVLSLLPPEYADKVKAALVKK